MQARRTHRQLIQAPGEPGLIEAFDLTKGIGGQLAYPRLLLHAACGHKLDQAFALTGQYQVQMVAAKPTRPMAVATAKYSAHLGSLN